MSKEQNNYNPFAALKKSDFPDKPMGKSDKDVIPKTKIIAPKYTKSTAKIDSQNKQNPTINDSMKDDLFQEEEDSSLFFANMGQVSKLAPSAKELKRKELAQKTKKKATHQESFKENFAHIQKKNISLEAEGSLIHINETDSKQNELHKKEKGSILKEEKAPEIASKQNKKEINSFSNNLNLQEQMLALKKAPLQNGEQEQKRNIAKQAPKTTIISSKNKIKEEQEKELVEDDDALFTQAFSDVQSLNAKGRDIPYIPFTPQQNPENVSKDNTNSTKSLNPYQEMVNNSLEIALHTSEDYIEAHVLGLDLMTVGKLQAREYKPEAHIDLHGLTMEHAYNNLIAFFRNAYQRGLRAVLVVTGKGKNSINNTPILRNKTCEWFTQDPFKRVILAFCTAKIEDGGAGALYVLVRKPKKDYGVIDWNVTPTDTDLFL